MSNPTSNQNNNAQATSTSASPAPTPSATFNYAAAAKSKQQQQQANTSTATSSPAQTPQDGLSRVATPNGQPPTRGKDTISMPKQAAMGNAARQAAAATSGGSGQWPPSSGINFGTVADSNAALSSSPAVQPKSGEHLQGDRPTAFGSISANDHDPKDPMHKTVGFLGKTAGADENPAAANGGADVTSPTTAAQRPAAPNFQKLFQVGGSKKTTAAKPANDATSNPPAVTSSPATAPAPASPAVRPTPAPASSALRPPQSGSQPFEPQRSPSSHFHAQRAPSGTVPTGVQAPPFHPHGTPQQQQRSPHTGAPQGVPHMMGQHPHFQPAQLNFYPQQMGGYHYPQYPGPQPWHPNQPQQQQQQHDMQGAPRSPRTNAPAGGASASPMPQHYGGPPGSTGASSSAPSVASPASSRAQAVSYSPSTAHTSIAPSPQQMHAAQHPLGMGHPSGGRPPTGYQPHHHHHPSGSYGGPGHAPSHSFGGAVGNPMSPGARQFQPSAQRGSSAIRIVNPDTKATVDIKSPAPSKTAASAAPASTAAGATSSPAPSHSSPAPPAVASPKPAAPPAPAQASGTTTASPAAPPASAVDNAASVKAKGFQTQQNFNAQVQARIAAAAAERAAEAEAAKKKADADTDAEAQKKKSDAEAEADKKKAEADAEAEKKKAADAEAAKKREEEEKAAAEKKKADEELARKEAEQKEQEAKAAAEAQETAAREKELAEAAAAAKQKEEEEAKRREESAKVDEVVDSQVPKDTVGSTEAKLVADESVTTEEKSGADAAKDAIAAVGPSAASKSVADIERMAREVSSVPPTPLETGVTRTPLFPTTPRTPGTPGFAGLPAKPMSSVNAAGGATASTAAAAAANGATSNFTLDSAQLESRRRPSNLDTAAAQRVASTATATGAATETPVSAASASLGSARFIEDLNKVTYPDSVQSPKKELNQSAEPGKFRYDRDFLLQFMGVYNEKPQDMPALASIGMEQGQMGGGRTGSGSRRTSGLAPGGSSGRGGPGAGSLGLGLGGSGFGRGAGAGGMGQFSHPAKTSEERFAQSTGAAGRGPPGGAFGSSGPMGSFAGGRNTQPLSRGGSGSGALPSRDMMGTGTPAGGRTQSRRGRTRDPGQGRGGNERVNPPEKGGPTIPMDQVVPLAHSTNRWQVGGGQKLSGTDPELVTRKVKALLNKLTIEKFASISDQILEWANKSTDETDGQTLRLVIALIFEKATDEAAWSEMYAQLCRKLMELLSTDVVDESVKNNEGQPVTGGALFRKYLLTRCQQDFEAGWAHQEALADAAKGKEAEDKAKKATNEKAEAEAKDAEARGEKTENKEAELLSEEYYAAQKAKRRGLGLVRFVGELYKLQMLTARIMHQCIKKLLHNTVDPEEEEVESLCKLLTTVGAQLDTDRAQSHMDIYVERMKAMNQSEHVNSRMKFMLLDVIELRAAGWKGSKQSAGPKSIAEIHEDAARQKQQQAAELAARSSSGRGGGGVPASRGGSRRGQQRGGEMGMGHDGWTAVGGASGSAPPPPRPTRAGDMSAFGKIERSGSGRPLSTGMGPNNVFAAKRQARTTEEGSKPPSRTPSSANMFEMLGQAENEQSSGGSGERPKLKLAPRTKPVEGEGEGEGEGANADGEEAKEGEEAGEKEESAGAAAEMSDEDASRKIDNDIKEFLEIRDVKEGALAMESLPVSRRSEFVGKVVEIVLNKKEDDVRTVGRLLAEVRSSSLMDDGGLEEGFKKSGIEMLDDISIDVPSVYKFTAILVVASGLAQERIEALAESIEGDGIKPPKAKFLEKVKEEQGA